MLFNNDIPEAMRTSIDAVLHRRHVAITKKDQAAGAFWLAGMVPIRYQTTRRREPVRLESQDFKT